MKITTFILTISISTGLFAQNSDDWILKSLNESFDLTEYDKPNELIKFNKDTIIVAGYLGNLSNSSVKNIVYKTIDSGKNWKVIEFNGDAWIYDSYHNKDGKIWMGGSDNYIHYSYDFGETWIRKIKPFNPVNRVLSIFMVNAEFGIAGGLSNGLAITYDNWETSKQIKTPLDQNKFKISKNSARNRTDKVAILDTLIFINQNNHIYYSNLSKIDWTEFNIPVSSFTIDENKKQIHLYSRNGKVFVLSSNLDLIKTYKEEFSWDEIQKDSVFFNTNIFFEKGVKSIKITSTKWTFDKYVHMSALYKSNTQIAKYVNKNGVLFFKSKEYRKTDLQLKPTELLSVFGNNEENFSLNKILNKLSFNEIDYNDYQNFIKDLKVRRKKEQKWGGDFTSQIKLTNSKFENFKISLDSINQKHINIIYHKLYLPFLMYNEQTNEILIEITNFNNEILKVSNKNSSIFSLPWTIELNGNKITSYNPEITEYIRTIIPSDFNNYEMLLGGELIYELKKEQIIDEIKYKKNGY